MHIFLLSVKHIWSSKPEFPRKGKFPAVYFTCWIAFMHILQLKALQRMVSQNCYTHGLLALQLMGQLLWRADREEQAHSWVKKINSNITTIYWLNCELEPMVHNCVKHTEEPPHFHKLTKSDFSFLEKLWQRSILCKCKLIFKGLKVVVYSRF